jgi:hypothetical protein
MLPWYWLTPYGFARSVGDVIRAAARRVTTLAHREITTTTVWPSRSQRRRSQVRVR